MKHHKAERWDWILKWLRGNHTADSLNQKFHKEYHERFPEYAQKKHNWGAQTVAQAMRDLRDMASSGMLDADRIGLCGGAWQPGLPTSVLVYSLSDMEKSFGVR